MLYGANDLVRKFTNHLWDTSLAK